jgi:hypothetical protein
MGVHISRGVINPKVDLVDTIDACDRRAVIPADVIWVVLDNIYAGSLVACLDARRYIADIPTELPRCRI